MDEIDEELAATVRARVGTSVCGGRYAIENVLGIGGMAAVYAGVHRNGRLVAMKFLHPEYSRRPDIRKRFVREGQAANAVHHPGVVAVIDDDVAEDGSTFLVMERLEGKSLEHLWEDLGRRLPARVALAIGRELCAVLVVAHAAGIFHRDIKPENLFLTNDGTLKVLDFGLAHLRDATRPKDTHTGMVFGTPAFMPPEQASGQTSKIDARTDIWAVGATLFTLLSGELVHPGESAQHFVMLAATEPARSLATAMPHAHPVLVEVVDRALARDKESRWQTAANMRNGIIETMDLLLGESDIEIPTIAELLAAIPARPIEKPAVKKDSDEPTQRKVAVIGADTDDTFSDATTLDNVARAIDSGMESTQPRAPTPPSNSSNTPTEQTTPDELPTRVRALPESAPLRVDDTPVLQKRASWSELRNAIEESKRPKPSSGHIGIQDTPQDETLLLHQQTAVIRHSSKGIPVAAQSRPAPPRFQDRPSHPALLPLRPDKRTAITRGRSEPSSFARYGPIVGAAVLLGLSPLAYVLGRNSSDSSRAPTTSPALTAPPPPSSGASSAATSALPPAATKELSSEVAIPAGPAPPPSGNRPTLTPPPLPPNPYSPTSMRSSSAPAAPPTASSPCAQPFQLDADGIKRWRPECLR